MELFFLVFIFVLVIGMAITGLWKGNPWLTGFACVFAIGLGALLLSEGVETPKIVNYGIHDTNDTFTQVIPEFEVIPPTNSLIASLGYALLGGGFVFLLLTIYYAFKGNASEAIS